MLGGCDLRVDLGFLRVGHGRTQLDGRFRVLEVAAADEAVAADVAALLHDDHLGAPLRATDCCRHARGAGAGNDDVGFEIDDLGRLRGGFVVGLEGLRIAARLLHAVFGGGQNRHTRERCAGDGVEVERLVFGDECGDFLDGAIRDVLGFFVLGYLGACDAVALERHLDGNGCKFALGRSGVGARRETRLLLARCGGRTAGKPEHGYRYAGYRCCFHERATAHRRSV